MICRMDSKRPRWFQRAWFWVLAVGAVMWLTTLISAIVTKDRVLVPEVLLFGGFLVPMALLFWVLEELERDNGFGVVPTVLDPSRILIAFTLGGGIGLTSSALIEKVWAEYWPRLFFFDVAWTEELVTFAAIWLLALPLARYSRRDGMLLGAAVGLGFSALESTGYAFDLLATNQTLNAAFIQQQLVRGALTPVGHGLWAALVGGALFASARGGKLRMSWNVAGWLAVAIGLHALWDMSLGMASAIVVLADGGTPTLRLVAGIGAPAVTGSGAATVQLINGVIQVIIAVVGIVLVVLAWRRANRDPAGFPGVAAAPAGR